MLPPTVIGVPGEWSDPDSLVEAIAMDSGGYVVDGELIVHRETEERFGIHVYKHDSRMREAFELVGGGQIPEEDLERIGKHTFTVYLLGNGTKTTDYVHSMMQAAAGLLNAGGLGVKIESTGVAHSKVRWSELMSRDPKLGVLYGFVAYILDGEGTSCSCGLHSVGLPDAMVEGMSEADAGALLKSFVGFQYLEDSEMNDGDTFQAGEDQPIYKVTKEACTLYEEDDLFFNANGMWRLSPMGEAK